jgi:hypothetical protein
MPEAVVVRPTLTLILRCRVSGLEGEFQRIERDLEPSFEASLRFAPQDEGF